MLRGDDKSKQAEQYATRVLIYASIMSLDKTTTVSNTWLRRTEFGQLDKRHFQVGKKLQGLNSITSVVYETNIKYAIRKKFNNQLRTKTRIAG